jgi:transposase-like protein
MARRTLTLTDQDKAEMLRLYVSDRKGIVEIGKQFGISPSTVSRFLKVQGGVLRPRGTRSTTKTEVLVNPLESHEPEAHRTECFPKVFVKEDEDTPTFTFPADFS